MSWIALGALSLVGCAKKESPEKATQAEPLQTTTPAPTAKAQATPEKAAARETAEGYAEKNGEESDGKSVIEKLEAAGRLPPVKAKPANKVPASPGDPEAGDFTLAEATAGLAGEGKLIAEIVTELGTMSCELYEDKAPITVANFVGLSRGKRAWKKGSEWVKTPLYNGTTFHRVIKTFMIQGGDPNGNGTGGPGYVIPDEIWEGGRHSERGLLCMANAGPDTNGSQFFILNNMALQLDGGYTIFGKCKELDVIDKIASVPVRGDRAEKPPVIKQINVKRVKE